MLSLKVKSANWNVVAHANIQAVNNAGISILDGRCEKMLWDGWGASGTASNAQACRQMNLVSEMSL